MAAISNPSNSFSFSHTLTHNGLTTDISINMDMLPYPIIFPSHHTCVQQNLLNFCVTKQTCIIKSAKSTSDVYLIHFSSWNTCIMLPSIEKKNNTLKSLKILFDSYISPKWNIEPYKHCYAYATQSNNFCISLSRATQNPINYILLRQHIIPDFNNNVVISAWPNKHEQWRALILFLVFTRFKSAPEIHKS